MTNEPNNATKASNKKHCALRIILATIVALVVVGSVVFAIYVNDYYRADERASAALQSAEDVQVYTLSNGDIVFEPANPQAGIVFYPGGKVQAEAYAPLMQDLAQRGFVCVIVPMPFNLAVFNVNGASGVQEQIPSVQKWILMGHSLGGSMAATYIDGHSESWDGLVLLASYSTSDLTENNLEVIRICGSEDGVLDEQTYADNRSNLSHDSLEIIIPGGNHAQFGDYGAQEGDGEPNISSEEQQKLTADEIARVFLD